MGAGKQAREYGECGLRQVVIGYEQKSVLSIAEAKRRARGRLGDCSGAVGLSTAKINRCLASRRVMREHMTANPPLARHGRAQSETKDSATIKQTTMHGAHSKTAHDGTVHANTGQ